MQFIALPANQLFPHRCLCFSFPSISTAGNLSTANLFHGNRSFADNRVVIVLFDGFRVDALTRNDELRVRACWDVGAGKLVWARCVIIFDPPPLDCNRRSP